jgi:hypothetical protein
MQSSARRVGAITCAADAYSLLRGSVGVPVANRTHDFALSSKAGPGNRVVSADNAIYLATIWAIPVIIAITFHEAAHGFVAHLLGDDTAWRLGRVSFNPLKHVDPFGTILLPGVLLLLHSPFLFGYAKPVPVNFRALRRPRRDNTYCHRQHLMPFLAVRPEGANHQGRKNPPGEFSMDPVADERLMRVTAWGWSLVTKVACGRLSDPIGLPAA